MELQWMQGTGVAVVTPFTRDGQVDLPALRRTINHLIKGEVEYLVALGTTGESPTLTHLERDQVFEVFFELAEGKLPVVIGIGGNDTAGVYNSIQEVCQRFDPHAILSVSPAYNRPTQQGLFAHYEEIAKATDLPIILYNVPARTGQNMTADTTLKLAETVPHIVAMKEASGDFAQIMEIIQGAPAGFNILSGDDPLTLPLLALGASGVISVSANAFPKEFSEMVRAGLEGDFEKAKSLHYKLLPIIRMHFAEGNPAGVKATMASMGLCEPTVRLPLVEASEDLRKQIDRLLAVW